ncbi:hypothetical protein Rsub_02612 [Raphidocelis subcapitata]|uniref:Uncharacterized protein n=1 Tax=Raphidocelis subcapitata TaxID=307507 RepID=A0A2V0NQG6_9CHLO|nr:hypothetical protein Rsub_02612 [Raphidocelis subcapitata]|eukprot:GBF89908.1 hypothetical protein Rsub_02612 [Raphidocelis subcapitata]
MGPAARGERGPTTASDCRDCQVWALAGPDAAAAARDSADEPGTPRASWSRGGAGICRVAHLDLVDSPEGESLRLYFDAQLEEDDMAQPMASSLAMVDLPPPPPAPPRGAAAPRAAAALAPAAAVAPASGRALCDAWAAAAAAWYPDAAFVSLGRPGHHQGCLVWGGRKAAALLDALSGAARCGRALVFAYGSHPVDAAMLGRRPNARLASLLEVPPNDGKEDLWCRLPGAQLKRLDGTISDHHSRRLAELRLASAAPPPAPDAACCCLGAGCADGACGGGFCSGPLPRLDGAWRGGGACDASSGAASPLWRGQSDASSWGAGSSTDGTPPADAGASGPPSRRSSASGGAAGGAGEEGSPFAALFGEEAWEGELVIVARGQGCC